MNCDLCTLDGIFDDSVEEVESEEVEFVKEESNQEVRERTELIFEELNETYES